MAEQSPENNEILSVRVGPLALRSPLIGASGTCGFGQELAEFGVLPALGAFITKTVTREARQGNPPPRTCETRAGLMNSIGPRGTPTLTSRNSTPPMPTCFIDSRSAVIPSRDRLPSMKYQ